MHLTFRKKDPMTESFSDRVSRIAHDQNISGTASRRVAKVEIRIETRMAELARERAHRAAWLARRDRHAAIRKSHVEGVSYGNTQLLHKGRKP